MSPVVNAKPTRLRANPAVLVVDDEPALLELVRDVVSPQGQYRIFTASDLAGAKAILAREKIDLLVADISLPDGDGMTLLPKMASDQPNAAAIVITGNPTVQRAVSAIRAGVVDFLPKPFSADDLRDRFAKALSRQAADLRNRNRLVRLRQAVKKLNSTRHTISRKVDLLCNDLVSAYGELSRQLDQVRTQESFRKLLYSANDLEQMLCHAMDWLLRKAGYCNVAIWLASEDHNFELGAYMKYTIAGEPQLTEAMQQGLLPLISRETCIHLFGNDAREQLTPAELKLLAGQEILGVNCSYLGESLAAVVMFRDEKSPFTDEDVQTLRTISPIFAVALANIVRNVEAGDEEESEDGSVTDEPREPKDKKSDADWWKRGEPPPF